MQSDTTKTALAVATIEAVAWLVTLGLPYLMIGGAVALVVVAAALAIEAAVRAVRRLGEP